MSEPPPGGPVAPIQTDFHDRMNRLARELDDFFNGESCPPEEKQVWFFLAAGNFAPGEEPEISRFNYISNADKLDIRTTLHEVLARIEARLGQEGQA